MVEYLSRIATLVGDENIEKLKNKHVLVCGVGGVGSFVAEALARSGVGKLTIVDFDVVDKSNLNRQLMTSKENIGLVKVDVLGKRLSLVSDCEIVAINKYIDESFELLEHYDYVVDCIDKLSSKFHLVKLCHENRVPILCALGSAKRISPVGIRRTTLDKTQNDPLAKAFRNLVRKERYNQKIDVVFIDSPPIDCIELGSSIFAVGSVGLFVAYEVFKDLLNS